MPYPKRFVGVAVIVDHAGVGVAAAHAEPFHATTCPLVAPDCVSEERLCVWLAICDTNSHADPVHV